VFRLKDNRYGEYSKYMPENSLTGRPEIKTGSDRQKLVTSKSVKSTEAYAGQWHKSPIR